MGRVGIGTNRPNTRLEIDPGTISDGATVDALRLSGTIASGQGGSGVALLFAPDNYGNGQIERGWIVVRRLGSDEDSRMDFDVGYYTPASGYQMRPAVLSLTGQDGYVGVGTAQPGGRLDVVGNVRASGSYYAGTRRIADGGGVYFAD